MTKRAGVSNAQEDKKQDVSTVVISITKISHTVNYAQSVETKGGSLDMQMNSKSTSRLVPLLSLPSARYTTLIGQSVSSAIGRLRVRKQERISANRRLNVEDGGGVIEL